MKYSSFCIINEVLYLSTSDLNSLMGYLENKGLDTNIADQGRLYQTSSDCYIIICSLNIHEMVKDILKDTLKMNLYFRGSDITPHNYQIKKVKYVLISDTIYTTSILKMIRIKDIICGH